MKLSGERSRKPLCPVLMSMDIWIYNIQLNIHMHMHICLYIYIFMCINTPKDYSNPTVFGFGFDTFPFMLRQAGSLVSAPCEAYNGLGFRAGFGVAGVPSQMRNPSRGNTSKPPKP